MVQLTLDNAEDQEQMIRDMRAKLKTKEKKIEYILRYFRPSSGDNLQLQWRYYNIFEPDKVKLSFTDFKMFRLATKPDTIMRLRRLIQAREKKKKEAGLPFDEDLLPLDKTINKRKVREEAMREIMREEGER